MLENSMLKNNKEHIRKITKKKKKIQLNASFVLKTLSSFHISNGADKNEFNVSRTLFNHKPLN